MTKLRPIALLVAFVLIAFTASCSEMTVNTDYKFSSGYKLSEKELAELKENLTDTDVPSETTVEITDATVFYWTDGGGKLHLFTTCQALSKADASKIKQGFLEDAYYANKTEPCSFCLKIANLTVDSFPVFVPPETSKETTKGTISNDRYIYIWTKDGTKLHLFENCTYLSKTPEENKIRGSKESALEDKISEICSSCQKNAQNTD